MIYRPNPFLIVTSLAVFSIVGTAYSSSANALVKSFGDSTVSMVADSDDNIIFEVSVPMNQYVGIGFGESMTNTNEIVFFGTDPPSVLNVYSAHPGKPGNTD
jgi:hypothetical protein